ADKYLFLWSTNFFFSSRRRHTRWPRDWSSDVCSSDLVRLGGFTVALPPPTLSVAFLGTLRDKVGQGNSVFSADGALDGTFQVTLRTGSGARTEIGRASCRESGWSGVVDTDSTTENWDLGAMA